ncbi:hypothetical protein J5837_07265, partial [Pseudoxanthomonas helianthi]
MKQETVHALITAKTILDEARQLISLANQHTCSAGLIFLQDALEIVFLSCLKEIDADQDKSLESLSFDQLIGELGLRGIKVPKSGSLKALNKQRIIVKHYGQLTDPVSTATYLSVANDAISSTLRQVIGKDITDVFLSDLLPANHQLQPHLQLAASLIANKDYFGALVETRKAYFLEIESEYCVYQWKDISNTTPNFWMQLLIGGWKAPFNTRNKEWISANVKEPVEYVQIDAERLRIEAIEWGVSTSDLHNISQLTPQAVQLENNGLWHTKIDHGYRENIATALNARYCLDRMIYVAFKKHQHQAARLWKQRDLPSPPKPIYLTHPVFERPDQNSQVIHVIQEGFTYSVNNQVTGFDPAETFLNITVHPPRPDDTPPGEGPWPFHGFVIDHGP